MRCWFGCSANEQYRAGVISHGGIWNRGTSGSSSEQLLDLKYQLKPRPGMVPVGEVRAVVLVGRIDKWSEDEFI